MMSFYQQWILPPLIHVSMRNKRLRPYRERVAGAAQGRVLDVGIGSGLNLPLYAPRVGEIFGLDPSSWLLARARSNAQRAPSPVHLLEGSAERIPLADRSMDTVVLTWTGCGIPDVATALGEMRRVLKVGGRLLFVEHGRAPEPGVARWQDRVDPMWHRIAGGCHLNRKIDDLLVAAGFRVDRLDTGYIRGPRIMSFFFTKEPRRRDRTSRSSKPALQNDGKGDRP
jgi:SAM-dependent methyltransferase